MKGRKSERVVNQWISVLKIGKSPFQLFELKEIASCWPDDVILVEVPF